MNPARIMDTNMHLVDLISPLLPLAEEFDACIAGLALDSRQVNSGDLFLACKGDTHDGRNYIESAIQQGAVAVLVDADDSFSQCEMRNEVPVVPIVNLAASIGHIAARFYDYPARQLWLIGITGTNGKTSIAQFIAQSYQALGKPCGISGTLGTGLYGQVVESRADAPSTTPDAVEIQGLYRKVKNAGAKVMTMEVSSHGLQQQRLNVDDIEVAVFTNLSRDHLDYHGTMQAYGDAKRQLFSGKGLKVAVINLDDPFSNNIIQELGTETQLCTYSLNKPEAAVYASRINHRTDGIDMDITTPWGECNISSSLLGSFNASNLLAAITAVLATESRKPNFDFNDVVKQVAKIKPVNGRMEIIGQGSPTVVVDYAHTPDALKTVLQALREHSQGKLWCVFGCGGNRDAGKRPLMAEMAEQFADTVVVTDDNPRDEASSAIIADIIKGFSAPEAVVVESDRASAIAYAIVHAAANDVVLLAGKGHETYQDVSGTRLPFSDVKQARLSLQQRSEEGGGQ